MIEVLRYGVLVSLVYSLTILTFMVLRTRLLGGKRLHSVPRGSWKKGVIYAFGKGLMPWEKESARKHLWTYLAGIGYHLGIFSGFIYMFHLLFAVSPGLYVLNALRFFLLAGFALGVGLFLKRNIREHMRKISCPDDYVANVFVDLFLLLALLDTFLPTIRPVFYVLTILLLIYLPVGKIRHCFFFFYSRFLFGHFFGRRGVFPAGQKPLDSKGKVS
jgi:hypothetical protein